MNIVSIGFYAEGTSDYRFLYSIIQRTFEDVAMECKSEIEVHPLEILTTTVSGFTDEAIAVSRQAEAQGILVVCLHADADARTDVATFERKINPALTAVRAAEPAGCTTLVAVVPVQMMEAWILADKELLKDALGTTSSDHDLGLERAPEAYADPKEAIEEAIRRAFEHRPHRHRKQVTLGGLYQPLGQKIALSRLAALPSYQKFREGVRQAFRQLNYLH
ncbi:MAG: hypothetical protein ACRYFX_31650 [Janthinobacterium lividum]